MEAELATILLENLDARVGELCRLGAASESAQVARIAHAIRGVALNFGTPRLAAAAHAIEALARAGAVADDDAEALVQEVDLVRFALQTRLALRRP